MVLTILTNTEEERKITVDKFQELMIYLKNKLGYEKMSLETFDCTLFHRKNRFNQFVFKDSEESIGIEIELNYDIETSDLKQVNIYSLSETLANLVTDDIKKFMRKEEIIMEKISKITTIVEGKESRSETVLTAKGVETKVIATANLVEPKQIRIKYFEGATELEKISKGDWIDVYARKDVFIPFLGQAMIPLGFAMELPKGMEGHLAPRGSTMKSWGMIQTNSVGIVDNSFAGDNDEWQFPAQCTMPHECIATQIEGHKVRLSGTWVRKGDKVAQFKIVDNMEDVEFIKVESLGNADRGMEGSTGTTKLSK